MDPTNLLLDCALPLAKELLLAGETDDGVMWLQDMLDQAVEVKGTDEDALDFEQEQYREAAQYLIHTLLKNKRIDEAKQAFRLAKNLRYVNWKSLRDVPVPSGTKRGREEF